MRTVFGALLVAALIAPSLAGAQVTNVRVRGTITAVDERSMAVRARDGRDLRLALAENLGVAVATAVRFEDIQQGDYVGSAAMERPDGTLVALEVHYLAPNVPAGFGPWDLEPNSTMTNANVVAKVQDKGQRELTLRWKDGERRIVVPEAAPIVRAVPGSRADLVPGEYVFVAAQQSPEGTLTAQRIQVSRNGVRPPQ